LLVANANGTPIFRENSAKIVPKLEIGDVDYETGDINFDGSVHIRGTMRPGFKVNAGGDILVVDTVEGADLQAGGSINFRCGVFGKSQTQIITKGNIRAKFLHECIVYCEGNLEVEDLIANCQIICEGMVEVGQKGGKGQIYGGKTVATRGVHAKILGAVTELGTLIEVSPSPNLLSRQQEIIKEIGRAEWNLSDVRKSLQFLRSSSGSRTDSRIESYTETSFNLMERLDQLKEEQAEIESKLQARNTGKIVAGQVHPGVQVTIGHRRKAIASFMQSFSFEPPKEAQPAA